MLASFFFSTVICSVCHESQILPFFSTNPFDTKQSMVFQSYQGLIINQVNIPLICWTGDVKVKDIQLPANRSNIQDCRKWLVSKVLHWYYLEVRIRLYELADEDENNLCKTMALLPFTLIFRIWLGNDQGKQHPAYSTKWWILDGIVCIWGFEKWNLILFSNCEGTVLLSKCKEHHLE